MARTFSTKRNRKGQFVAVHRSTAQRNPRKKKRAAPRRNFTGAAQILNPKRRHHRRKKAAPRRNPGLGSLRMPAIMGVSFDLPLIAGVAGGIAGPSLLQGVAKKFFPTLTAQNPTLTKIGAVGLTLAAAYVIDGKRGVRNAAAGVTAMFAAKGIASLLTSAGLTTSLNGMGRNIGPVGPQALAGKIGPVPQTLLAAGRYNNRSGRMNSRFSDN